MITVFNKIDLYKKDIENNNYNLVSAQTGHGIEELKIKLGEYQFFFIIKSKLLSLKDTS